MNKPQISLINCKERVTLHCKEIFHVLGFGAVLIWQTPLQAILRVRYSCNGN